MLKKITKIDFGIKIKYLFLENNELFISGDGHKEKIAAGVKSYGVSYEQSKAYLHYIVQDQTISIASLELIDESITYNRILHNIPLLKLNLINIGETYLFIDKIGRINLIFGYKNRGKITTIYLLKLDSLGNVITCNPIVNNLEVSIYDKIFTPITIEDKLYLFILGHSKKVSLNLYDIENLKLCDSFLLEKAINLRIVFLKDRYIFLYYKMQNRELEYYYRALQFENGVFTYGKEKSLPVTRSIINPEIFVGKNQLIYKWKATNYFYELRSENLEDFKEFEEPIVEGALYMKIKEINIKDYISENYYWINMKDINLIQEKKIEENGILEVSNTTIKDKEDHNFVEIKELRLGTLEILIELEKCFNDKRMEYIGKIKELNTIIEEKERLISSLLEIK